MNQKYSINEDFFKEWSKEMAYVLGLILTDGCIANTLQSVSLTMNDRLLLEKVRSVMGTNIPVEASKRQPRFVKLIEEFLDYKGANYGEGEKRLLP